MLPILPTSDPPPMAGVPNEVNLLANPTTPPNSEETASDEVVLARIAGEGAATAAADELAAAGAAGVAIATSLTTGAAVAAGAAAGATVDFA